MRSFMRKSVCIAVMQMTRFIGTLITDLYLYLVERDMRVTQHGVRDIWNADVLAMTIQMSAKCYLNVLNRKQKRQLYLIEMCISFKS